MTFSKPLFNNKKPAMMIPLQFPGDAFLKEYAAAEWANHAEQFKDISTADAFFQGILAGSAVTRAFCTKNFTPKPEETKSLIVAP